MTLGHYSIGKELKSKTKHFVTKDGVTYLGEAKEEDRILTVRDLENIKK